MSRREQSLPLLWWLHLLFLDVGGGARVVGVCGGCVWMLFCVSSRAPLRGSLSRRCPLHHSKEAGEQREPRDAHSKCLFMIFAEKIHGS